MNVAVVRKQHQIARPLKVLVPLIQNELIEASAAGLDHFRRAGEMLVEAKEQVSYGSWGRWLSKNFELSQNASNSIYAARPHSRALQRHFHRAR